MGKGKPGGDYVEDLTEPGGWTDADEDKLDEVAAETIRALQQLTFGAFDPWQRERSETFDGGGWSGDAAGAANGKAGTHSEEFAAQQNNLVKVATWNRQVATLVINAKTKITHNVQDAQKKIKEIENLTLFGPLVDALIQAIAINHIIDTYRERNVSEITSTAAGIPEASAWNSPPKALEQLLNEKQAPIAPANPTPAPIAPSGPSKFASDSAPGVASGLHGGGTPQNTTTDPVTDSDAPTDQIADQPAGVLGSHDSGPTPTTTADPTTTPDIPAEQPAGVLGSHDPTPTPTTTADPTTTSTPPPGAIPPAPISPAQQGPRAPMSNPSPVSTTSGPTGTPASSTPSGVPTSPAAASGTPTAPTAAQPATAGPAADASAAKAPVAPMQSSSPMSSSPVSAPSVADPHPASPAPASTQAAPATSSGPATSAPVSAPSGGTGGGTGGGMGGGMPLGAPPTAPPAAPVAPPAAAAVPPPAAAAPPPGGAQVAPIPVSAARAERDAAQNAARRNIAEQEPLNVARRIAAALNAPDMVNVDDFFFHWITAVTKDGKIVVANNYGLAYIPEQVQLPEQVVMVSADEAIPAAERGSWATFPIVAVQRWAQHHDKELRAVIGTEEQLAGTDAGAHQVILTPEDIPASGKMSGRSRLQVIAPEISARLAGFSDADLISVLPPAPADSNPPEDQRADLWDRVWQPLCSSASNRGKAHLQAFLAYAIHAQEQAFYEVHTAAEPEDQRKAADAFIYWQHVGQTIADALAT